MEITQEMLDAIWDKAIKLAELRGYKTDNFDYLYLRKRGDGDGIKLVGVDSSSYDLDDRTEITFSIEELNMDMTEALAVLEKQRKDEQKALKRSIAKRLKEIKQQEEEYERKQYEKLKEKYDNS